MKVCLFDIDGTLIRSGGAGQQAFLAALSEQFGIAEVNGNVAFSGRTDRAIVNDFFTLHRINATADAWTRFRAAYLEHLPSKLAANDGTVLPGVSDVLQQSQARNDVAVGLLTGNMASGAKAKLSHYGIDRFFQFGGFGDEHLNRDDVAHEALVSARAHVGPQLQPTDVIVIGDTPLDIRCARAIGAKAVAVCTGFCSKDDLQAAEPDLLLDDLTTVSTRLATVLE